MCMTICLGLAHRVDRWRFGGMVEIWATTVEYVWDRADSGI
jgi:hypothetical protein